MIFIDDFVGEIFQSMLWGILHIFGGSAIFIFLLLLANLLALPLS